MLSLRHVDIKSMTVPLGSTASTPSTLARMEPYRSSRRPPGTTAKQIGEHGVYVLWGLCPPSTLLTHRQAVLHILFADGPCLHC